MKPTVPEGVQRASRASRASLLAICALTILGIVSFVAVHLATGKSFEQIYVEGFYSCDEGSYLVPTGHFEAVCRSK